MIKYDIFFNQKKILKTELCVNIFFFRKKLKTEVRE